jgi:preprotein translocase subunit SecG
MLVVLIQPGKSGGLGAALGGAGAQQIFGGRGAGNFLTRTTWITATVFFLTSVTLAYVSTSTGDSLEDLANQPSTLPLPLEKAGDEPPPSGATAPGTDGTPPSPAPENPSSGESSSPPAEPAPQP